MKWRRRAQPFRALVRGINVAFDLLADQLGYRIVDRGLTEAFDAAPG